MWTTEFTFLDSTYRLVSDREVPSSWLSEVLPPQLSETHLKPSFKGEFFLQTRDRPTSAGLYWEEQVISGFSGFNDESARGVGAMIQTTLASRSLPNYLFVHAGAVAFNDQGIIYPGLTRSGKSTLTKALLDAGATYYSDDCAVLDKEGNLFAYLTPLKQRVDGINQKVCEFREVGEATPPKVKVKLILFTSFEGGGSFSPITISRTETIWRLLENVFYPPAVRDFPADTLEISKAASNTAISLSGTRGEADEAVAEILARCLD